MLKLFEEFLLDGWRAERSQDFVTGLSSCERDERNLLTGTGLRSCKSMFQRTSPIMMSFTNILAVGTSLNSTWTQV